MKTLLKTVGLVAALTFALAGQVRAQDDTAANPDTGVSFQTFYDQLASQGTWVQTDKYGYVFQPTESDPNWRPYTYGHWVNTDQGMTWVSDEPFGWATYHYGRWTNIDGYGWVWVPGYTWAPSWVSWREDADNVGWAPLPPDSDQGIDYYNDDDYFTGADFGFHIGDDCDLAYGIGPWWYNFCPVVFIGDRDCWRHFRDRRDNFGFIRHTRNVTNINFRRDGAGRFGHVRAEGPNVAALNERAHTPIAHASLTAATRMNEVGLHGHSLAVFAPRINPATAHTARPAAVGRTLTDTRVNRGTDISRPVAVNSRVVSPAATTAQMHAASLAATGPAAANARVATDTSHFSRTLSQPLTTMRAGTRPARTFEGGISQPRAFHSGPAAASSIPAESRFTGAPETRQATVTPRGPSAFGGERMVPRSVPSARSFPSAQAGQVYHPSSIYPRTSTPSFRQGVPSYHAAPSYHSFAPARSFTPSRSFAPASHYSAPAAHFSGGNFGGGARSAGGGGSVSSGGGHGGGGGGVGGGGVGHR